MTAIDRHLPQFIIGKHDRITFPTVGMLPGMPGKSMRLVYATDDGVVLRPAEGAGPSETFSYAQLRRMNAAREIHHEPEFYLPVAQRSATLRNELDVIAPAMTAMFASREWIWRHGYERLARRGRAKPGIQKP